MPTPRPKYLNLIRIRLPLPGIVSILHRISGAALFIFMPLLLYLFGSSVDSPTGFGTVATGMSSPLFKLLLFGLMWAFLHHVCAGVRYLALDLDYGTDLVKARASSKMVLAVSIGLTVVLGAKLW
jgi:succinate dehydrogenase / fumarate reductase cytochrome b subunit